MNLKLASEASNVLDFGDGTKVRIGNTTVTLKGRFFRQDSAVYKGLEESYQMTLRENRAVGKCIDRVSVEKYPYDAHRPISERIETVVKNLEFERKEKQKLLEMVSSRDTTISNLKCDVEFLKREMRNSIRNMREHILDKLSGAIKGVVEKADFELEKSNVV